MTSISKIIPVEVAFDITAEDIKSALRACTPAERLEILEHIVYEVSKEDNNQYASEMYLANMKTALREALRNVNNIKVGGLNG